MIYLVIVYIKTNSYYKQDVTSEGQRVISFTHTHPLKEEFERFRSIAAQEVGPMQENYAHSFDKNEHPLLSLVFEKDNPIMMSTLYTRQFYGRDVARCLSRVWKSKSFRSTQKALEFPERLQLILAHQVDYSMSQRGFKFLFISHQGQHKRLMSYWAKHANRCTKLSWRAASQRYLVCPNPKAQSSCWQWICYAQIDLSKKIPFKGSL